MKKGTFTRRLNELVNLENINMRQLERDSGVSYESIRGLNRDKSKSISVEYAYSIAKALGFTLDQVFNGNFSDDSLRPFPSVPRYDAVLSAGYGSLNQDAVDVLDRIPFTQDFLQKKLGRPNTDGLICCDASGESMEPNISDGDLLIIDSTLKYEKPGIYALLYGDDAYVKRVEKIGPDYACTSDHPSYSSFTAKPNETGLDFIGKIVWVGRVFV